MKKTFMAITLAASIFALSACNSNDEVIVSTKYGDITKEEFYNEMKSLVGKGVLEQVLIEQILENNYKVTDKEVNEELDKVKEQLGDQYESFLATNNIDEKTYKNYIRLDLLQRKATLDVEVTDEEIEKYYEQAKYELNARHILFSEDEKELAEEVLEKIKNGEDFATLAKEYSKDTGTAEDGGNLGWFTVGTMLTEFNDAAYELEKNEVSGLVKTSVGYHIIQLLDKREVENFGTLEEKKEDIRKAIQEQKGNWENKAVELIKAADIKIKDKDLKGALEAFTKSE